MKRLLIVALILLITSQAWSVTYYMRADGTAANLAASTGPTTDATHCMSISSHNGFTITSGNTVEVSDKGGNYSSQLIPKAGLSYIAATGETPVWDMGGADAYAIQSSSNSNVTIRGITARNTIKAGGVVAGINVSGWTIDRCNLSGGGGSVVSLSGTGGSHTLSNSTITATNIGSSIAVNAAAPNNIIDNCTILNTTVTNPRESGYGIALGTNGILRNSRIGTDGVSAISYGFNVNIVNSTGYLGQLIEKNEIAYAWNNKDYNNGGKGAGIFLSGANTANTVVRYNHIHDNQRGYFENETVNNATGNNQVYYNLFENNKTNGIDIRYTGSTGYGIAFNNTVIHHINDVWLSGVWVGHGIAIQNGATRAKIFNNIIVADQRHNNDSIQCITVSETQSGTADVQLSNNQYYTTNNAYIGSVSSMNYADYADYVTALSSDAFVTVKETNSIYANPLFESSTNYRIQSSSSAIGAGVTITGVHDQATPATDLDGAIVHFLPPNMGAYDGRKSLVISSNFAPIGHAVRGTDTEPATLNLGTDNLIVDLSGLTADEAIIVKPKRQQVVRGFIAKGVKQYLKINVPSDTRTFGFGWP